MKFSIFIINLWLIVPCLNAQVNNLTYIQHAGIYGGVTFDQGIRNRDLDKLVNSYNAYFESIGELKTGLKPVRGNTGYYWGFYFQLFMLECGYEFARSQMHTEATAYSAAGARVWDFNYQVRTLSFTFWLNRFRLKNQSEETGKKLKVELGIPMQMISNDRVSLKSGYRYADGKISYGTERPLNGIYSFDLGNDMAVGLKLAGGFNRYRLLLEYMMIGVTKRKDPKYGMDVSAVDHIGEHEAIYSNQYLPKYLPDRFEDATTSVVHTATNAGNEKHLTVIPYFQGTRFRIGLLIDLYK